GTFMVWTSICAIRRREILVDQEYSDPVRYTAERTPVRYWCASILPLAIGLILLGRCLWLVWS
ncbi:MAG TPA: hypothetical protein VK477_04560, partial [Acidobacteriota bacterium]|nr:hypothetical protein [Acidobacteriota bacterium]